MVKLNLATFIKDELEGKMDGIRGGGTQKTWALPDLIDENTLDEYTVMEEEEAQNR